MPLKAWPSLPGTCQQCCEHVSSLQHHYRACHQLSCKVDYGDGTVHEVFRDQDAGGFPCAHCSRLFTTPRGLQDHARRSDCSRSKTGPKRSRKRARKKSDAKSNDEGRSPFKLKIYVPAHMRKGSKRPRLDTDGMDDDQTAEASETEEKGTSRADNQDSGSVHGETDAEVSVTEDVEMAAETEGDPPASDHEMSVHEDGVHIDGTDKVMVADADASLSVTEQPTERSSSPLSEPPAVHLSPQPIADADPEDTSATPPAELPSPSPVAVPTLSRSPEVAPTTPGSPEAVPIALDSVVSEPFHSGRQPSCDSEEVPSLSSAEQPREPQSAPGTVDNDAPVTLAVSREPGDVQPASQAVSPKSESAELPKEPLDEYADSVPTTPITSNVLVPRSAREPQASTHEETRAAPSTLSQQLLDEKLSSHHSVDDIGSDVGFLDLDAMELEYPSDEEIDPSLALVAHAPLPSVDGTLCEMDEEEPVQADVPPTPQPVPDEASSVRPCRDPLPPGHPVLEFLAGVDAGRPPPAHFARAFIDLGYDTNDLLDMLACAKPECGDWDALQAEMRTDKKYDAWWLRVKMALRERAARCLRRSGIFIRASSA